PRPDIRARMNASQRARPRPWPVAAARYPARLIRRAPGMPPSVSPDARSALVRRAAIALACALACALPLAAQAQPPAAAPSVAAPADPEYDRCVANRLRPQAIARGIRGEAFDRYMAGVAADRSVLELLDAQPEFTTPIWDYLAGLVDEERVADGKAMLAT